MTPTLTPADLDTIIGRLSVAAGSGRLDHGTYGAVLVMLMRARRALQTQERRIG
jgi:hypothetical protein